MALQCDRHLEVGLAQLQERYSALHRMRDRSMQFALWILGFGLGMGWLLVSGPSLTWLQALAVFAFVLVIGILSLLFISGIERGFNNNRAVVIRLETQLGLHDSGFLDSQEPILPKEFADHKVRWSSHFRTLRLLMIAVFLLVLVLALVSPFAAKAASGPKSDSPKTIGQDP